MARQILLTIGANGSGPGTPERGVRAIEQLFAAKGIHMPGMVVENGSGLSRVGRVTARGMGQLLLAAYRSAIMPEFMASMPIVGVDGTMRRRLIDTPVAGQAHIKTGLINDVRALAGYVLDAHGRRMVAVLLINHPRAGNANAVQDALLKWVYSR
jgi:D-alanyl-D-alanine carboxypeptidase/D-alanyl-D-alanine-endopeptidase (penicillin-binding protein 4)